MDWRQAVEMEMLESAQAQLAELEVCSELSGMLHEVLREALGLYKERSGGYEEFPAQLEAIMVSATRLHHCARAIMWLVAIGRSDESMPNVRLAIELAAKADELVDDSTGEKSEAWKERRGKRGLKLFNSFLSDHDLAKGLHSLLSEDGHGGFAESRSKMEQAIEEQGSVWFPGHRPAHDDALLLLVSSLLYRMIDGIERAFQVETQARSQVEQFLDSRES